MEIGRVFLHVGFGVGVREGAEIQPDAVPIKAMTQKLEATYSAAVK